MHEYLLVAKGIGENESRLAVSLTSPSTSRDIRRGPHVNLTPGSFSIEPRSQSLETQGPKTREPQGGEDGWDSDLQDGKYLMKSSFTLKNSLFIAMTYPSCKYAEYQEKEGGLTGSILVGGGLGGPGNRLLSHHC